MTWALELLLFFVQLTDFPVLRGWILWRWWAVDARGNFWTSNFLPSKISVISVIGFALHCLFQLLSTDLHKPSSCRTFCTHPTPSFSLCGEALWEKGASKQTKIQKIQMSNNSNVDSFDKSSYCIWIWISPIKLKLRCQATAGSSRPWSCLFQILIWTDRRHLHSFHFPFWTLHLWRFESFCILSSDICCMLWNLYAINSIGTHHVCPETNVVDKLLEGGVAQLPDGFVSLCLCTV